MPKKKKQRNPRCTADQMEHETKLEAILSALRHCRGAMGMDNLSQQFCEQVPIYRDLITQLKKVIINAKTTNSSTAEKENTGPEMA